MDGRTGSAIRAAATSDPARHRRREPVQEWRDGERRCDPGAWRNRHARAVGARMISPSPERSSPNDGDYHTHYAGDVAAGVVDLADDEIDGTATHTGSSAPTASPIATEPRASPGLTRKPAWISTRSSSISGRRDPLTLNAGLGVWLSPVLNPQWGYGGSGRGDGNARRPDPPGFRRFGCRYRVDPCRPRERRAAAACRDIRGTVDPNNV
jgi:hypothetical protein